MRWMLVILALVGGCKKEAPAPATRPATAPATTRAAEVVGYIDLVKRALPKVAATRPLDVPVDLRDAARVVVKGSAYLCARGDLWITDAGGKRIEEADLKEQVHVVRERVRFVHWTTDARGKPAVKVVISEGGRDWWVEGKTRHAVEGNHPCEWERASSWGERVVTPTPRGIALLDLGNDGTTPVGMELVESAGANAVQYAFTPDGFVAWSPWENGRPGSAGTVRYVEGRWDKLEARAGWGRLIHLVPMLDGSVLRLTAGEEGRVELSLVPLGAGKVDEKAITELVEKLSAGDPDVRRGAFAELSRYGNASWPVLEKLVDDQPPEARQKIRQLLANKIKPTLGGRTLIDGKARVVSRLADGGVVLFAQAGTVMPREGEEPEKVIPAWISIRPGRMIELLDPVLVANADPDDQKVYAWGDEWVIGDSAGGPERLEGNHLRPMLKDGDRAYCELVGMDRRGRWLFRKPGDPSATLVLDPTIPDPTPRLPVWVLSIKNGQVGWTKEGWPVVKRPGAWALRDSGWVAVDERKEKVIMTAAPPATTQGALATDGKGRRYYGGVENLRLVERGGRERVLQLREKLKGSTGPQVVVAGEKLFLFNSPGRVIRIDPEAMEVEAVFDRNVPEVKAPTRIWVDPAGRIVMAWESKLAVMFPEGRVPEAIARLMPAEALEEE